MAENMIFPVFFKIFFKTTALIFSVKWLFSVKLTFAQTAFGETAIRSNELSVKWHSVKYCSVKWCFGQMAFRSNGVRPNSVRTTDFLVKRRSVKKIRWNDFSVKWSRNKIRLFSSKNFRSIDFWRFFLNGCLRELFSRLISQKI
jgi:hypothetical protein